MNDIDIKIKSQADTSGLKEAKRETDRYGDSVEVLEEKADNSERSLIGTADIIGGIGGIMQGPGQQGMQSYIMAWADLGGGLAGVLPLLKAMSIEALKNAANQVKAAATTVASWVSAGATAVATAARVVASWVVMGAQATLNAARMAVAWVVALGPIPIIIAGLVALGVALVTAWKKSETFRSIVGGAFNVVKAAIGPVVSFARSLAGWFTDMIKIIGKLAAPLKAVASYFSAVGSAIAGAVGKLREWLGLSGLLVPIGGAVVHAVQGAQQGLTAPSRGGGTGSSGPAAQSFNGGGGGVQFVPVDGTAASRAMVEFMRKATHDLGGGSVQQAFGHG